MPYTHVAYGLRIRSDIQLGATSSFDGECDLRVEIQEAPIEGGLESGVLSADSGGGVYVRWQPAGHAVIRGGHHATIFTHADSDSDALRLFALGSLIPVALHQRGRVVLHASAVKLGPGVAVFAGRSGRGKSTIAAHFHRAGHELVSDDIVPIETVDGASRTWGGFPSAKLLPDAARAVGVPSDELEEIHPRLDKREWRPARTSERTPLRVRAIYLLDPPNEEPGGETTALEGQAALMELIGNCYTARLPGLTGTSAAHLQRVGALVRSVPVRRLSVVRSLEDLDRIRKAVMEDLHRNSLQSPSPSI